MIAVTVNERTGASRQFASYNAATETFPSAAVYTNPRQLSELPRINELAAKVYWFFKDQDADITWDKNAGAEWIFAAVIKHAPLIGKPPQAGTSSGFTIDLTAAKRVVAEYEAKTLKIPKQAAMLAKALVNNRFDYYSKAEMKTFARSFNCLMLIKTKQDGWRILRYYRPILTEQGVLK